MLPRRAVVVRGSRGEILDRINKIYRIGRQADFRHEEHEGHEEGNNEFFPKTPSSRIM
jgi:hypothetical protein